MQCFQYTKQLISWKNFKWEQKHHFSVKCTFLEKKHSPEVLYKEKLVIKILQNSNKNTSLSESLFYKICRSQVCNFIKNETPTQKFLRAPFLQNISERPLLFFQKTESIFFLTSTVTTKKHWAIEPVFTAESSRYKVTVKVFEVPIRFVSLAFFSLHILLAPVSR